MLAARLNKKILIEKVTLIKDDFGAEQEAWEIYLPAMAEIQYKSGSKGIMDKEIFTRDSVNFLIRYNPNIQTNMRVIFIESNARYKISGISVIQQFGRNDITVIQGEFIDYLETNDIQWQNFVDPEESLELDDQFALG